MYKRARLWIDVVSKLVTLSLAIIGLLEAIERVAKNDSETEGMNEMLYGFAEEDEP